MPQAGSEKKVVPPAASAIVSAEGVVVLLPYASDTPTVAAVEQLSTTTFCAALLKESAVGAAGEMTSFCVAPVSVAGVRVTALVPATVCFIWKDAVDWPVRIVT